MLGLLVTVALAQTPVALVQSSNFGVPARRTAELTHALSELIRLQGMLPVEASAPCENRECVLKTGRELKASAVVALAFATVGKDTLLDLEALSLSDQKSLALATFKVPAGSSLPAMETTQFLVTLKGTLPGDSAGAEKPTLEPEKKTDKDPRADLKFDNAPPEANKGVTSGGAPVWPAVTLGVAAIVAGAVSTILYVTGSSMRDSLNQQILGTGTYPYSSYSRQYAMATYGPGYAAADTQLKVSLVTVIAAGVLAVVAVVLLINALQ